MNVDIIETLNGIAQNEHIKFRAFRERLVEYCEKEQSVCNVYRVIKGIELELKDCINGRVNIDVDQAIVKKLLEVIRTELTIVKYKMRFPELVEFPSIKIPQPIEWIGDTIDVIELIYAIYILNKGKITLKALQSCFEYIFNVKLSNISSRFANDIVGRKGEKIQYLVTLVEGLNNFLIIISDRIIYT